jgi:thiamine-phosphate pyrophosphorylase
LEECIRQACRSGIRAVQLREKDLAGGELYRLARRLKSITENFGANLFINDRLDVAMAIGADGIQCPENGLPPGVVRQYAPTLKIGVSVHSPEAALRAEQSGADFLLFGPVFPTRSKPGADPRGVTVLNKIAGQCRIPVFAIGGITPDRARKCVDAGAWGVAGISSILNSDEINQTVAEYANNLGSL